MLISVVIFVIYVIYVIYVIVIVVIAPYTHLIFDKVFFCFAVIVLDGVIIVIKHLTKLTNKATDRCHELFT